MRATVVADFLLPGIMLIVAIVVDVSCYPSIINHYSIFGFDSELRSGLIALTFFTLIPIGWMGILLFANHAISETEDKK